MVIECECGDWEGGGTVLCPFNHGVLCMGGINEENKIDLVVKYTVHKDDESSTCQMFPVMCPSNN